MAIHPLSWLWRGEHEPLDLLIRAGNAEPDHQAMLFGSVEVAARTLGFRKILDDWGHSALRLMRAPPG